MIAISPARQLFLLALSLLCGFATGAVYDLFGVSALLLGAYEIPAPARARFQKPLPLVKRPVPFRRRQAGRVWRTALTCTLDCLFVLLLGATTAVVLYIANDGQFRAAAPLLLLIGFFAWRRSVGRLFDAGAPFAAFLLSAVGVYAVALLCLPPRLIGRGCRRLAVPIGRFFDRLAARAAQKKSRALCLQHVRAARRGFETERKVRPDHETGRSSTDKRADLGHPRHHHRHLLRRDGHYGRQTDGGTP